MIDRATWSAERGGCFTCPSAATDTHEIACGPGRAAALKEPAAWLRTCRRCHERLHDYGEWPIARQLALKWVCDRSHYRRTEVNLLRGRQRDAITHAEVMLQVPYVVAILMEHGIGREEIEAQLDRGDNYR